MDRGGLSKDPERVALVFVALPSADTHRSCSEFEALFASTGFTCQALFFAPCPRFYPRTLLGSGKIAELASSVQDLRLDLLIFSHDLTPAQERNLERVLQCRVLDRRGLILDIFARRARTAEGKIQVEWAQLKHLSTRLVRGWTHLERQKGGIGLRGPGETQLEVDRRLIRQRITQLAEKIKDIRMQRSLGRTSRMRQGFKTIALVGYTNAGKSTLFNALTGAATYAADQLFATLDPTIRRIQLPDVGETVLVDTVGFIQNLPVDFAAAFRATLEEVLEADLLLHVIDLSDEHATTLRSEVLSILEDIGAASVPILEVYNKIDRLEMETGTVHATEPRVFVSAKKKWGFEQLYAMASQLLMQESVRAYVRLGPDQGALRAKLYRHHSVRSEVVEADGTWYLEVCLPSDTKLLQEVKSQSQSVELL